MPHFNAPGFFGPKLPQLPMVFAKVQHRCLSTVQASGTVDSSWFSPTIWPRNEAASPNFPKPSSGWWFFTNPFEKYERQKWVHLPQFSGWKEKKNWNYHLVVNCWWNVRGYLPGVCGWDLRLMATRNPGRTHQLRLVVFPIIYRVSISRGCLGFLPSGCHERLWDGEIGNPELNLYLLPLLSGG